MLQPMIPPPMMTMRVFAGRFMRIYLLARQSASTVSRGRSDLLRSGWSTAANIPLATGARRDPGGGPPAPQSYQARTCFGSDLEGNKAPESRIGETGLSGFDVARKLVFEIRVSANPYDEVVPAKELIQHQLV